ncbi:MAG TPA: ferrous iron transport protein B [Candidatus Fimimorpha faecalis]|uniref:Ferrous iron transport protein B n=1 Tax=Candidatus Fimimorpha faecalis TaxID=2840824 RepID=A0A9D1JCK6_9FIRM|nr:ferrous iron transport protein B [Candidatus Fimimorpha faecalis]
MRPKHITVAFMGNPNCGKTTLFNAYTGANLKVANWPGVTVERKEGYTNYKSTKLTLVDLPGVYSLTSYTIEERVSRKEVLESNVDVIINVVDASSLERNLYLTMQLLELGKPVIVALNMMDIVEERGMEIDLHRLPEVLGDIPVVPVSARKRTGLDVLMHAVVHHYQEIPDEKVVTYSDEIENKIEQLIERLKKEYGDDHQILRWHAIKLLENDETVTKEHPILIEDIVDRSYENEIINQKYEYIEEVVEECLFNRDEKVAFTEKIDKWLTHPFWGLPIFLGIIALVFFLTFTIGDFLKGYFEVGLELFSGMVTSLLEAANVSDWMVSLIVDGIIAGVGGILTFLPNIFILFLALALLEDSGYMARVAYVMDGVMGKVGLSGKAFLPMVLGFGCTVPAVMATRALEKEADRKRTILLTPFMSCSARLPIYVLFADMFFDSYAMIVSYSLYIIGVVMAIFIALIVSKITKAKDTGILMIELPEYKTPNPRTIRIYVWEKVKDYLTKAGTIIFLASIVLWFVLNFNGNGMVTDVSESFGATFGHWMEPILSTAGLGMWQIGLALLCGISAKEVVVSSFSVLFSINNINSAAGMAALSGILGASGFTSLNAYALMIFCLLYTPCIATIATIKRETRSWKWTIGMVVFQLVLAWVVATLVFQIGRLL